MKITRRQLREMIKKAEAEALLNEVKPRLPDAQHKQLKQFVDNSLRIVRTIRKGKMKKQKPWVGISFNMDVQIGQIKTALEKLEKMLG